MTDVERLNKAFASVTVVARCEFQCDLSSGRCDVTLDLVDDANEPKISITVEARNVADLEISEFGGGLTQVQCLRVRNVSDLQHDRVAYVIEDLEDNVFALRCESFAVRDSTAGSDESNGLL